jgi:hypothetical protein
MRILFALALLSAASVARAADLPVGSLGGGLGHGERSEMVWLYDNQPGVVVRPYWSAPWHNHHYFPYTGIRPRVGRLENLSAVSHPSKPPQTYRRTWTNNWAIEHSPVILPGNEVMIGNQDVSANQNDNQQNSHHGSCHRLYAHGHSKSDMH